MKNVNNFVADQPKVLLLTFKASWSHNPQQFASLALKFNRRKWLKSEGKISWTLCNHREFFRENIFSIATKNIFPLRCCCVTTHNNGIFSFLLSLDIFSLQQWKLVVVEARYFPFVHCEIWRCSGKNQYLVIQYCIVLEFDISDNLSFMWCDSCWNLPYACYWQWKSLSASVTCACLVWRNDNANHKSRQWSQRRAKAEFSSWTQVCSYLSCYSFRCHVIGFYRSPHVSYEGVSWLPMECSN